VQFQSGEGEAGVGGNDGVQAYGSLTLGKKGGRIDWRSRKKMGDIERKGNAGRFPCLTGTAGGASWETTGETQSGRNGA